MKKQNKMFIVKREVWAKDMKEALHKDGEVYEVSLASEEQYRLQSINNNPIGFNK